jgi:hypothetical protein
VNVDRVFHQKFGNGDVAATDGNKAHHPMKRVMVSFAEPM